MTVYTKVVQDACIKGLGGVNCARVEYNINKISTFIESHSVLAGIVLGNVFRVEVLCMELFQQGEGM